MKNLYRFLFLALIFLPCAVIANSKQRIISPNITGCDCHCPCIIEVKPNLLCAVWRGGYGDGLCNVDRESHDGIWISFLNSGRWSKPELIIDSPDSVCWNPVLSKYPNGELALFYRVGRDPRHTISYVKKSADGGATWSVEEQLPEGIVGPTKSRPLFSNGSLISGSSEETEDESNCWIEIFADAGWSKYGPIAIPGKKFGAVEPTLFVGEANTLKLLCRDRSHKVGGLGWVWKAESNDGGKSWSELKKTELPNPDSAIDVLALSKENILLFYNHSQTHRYPLSIAKSIDSGNTWSFLLNIEDESGEFPSATLDDQGNLHVVYATASFGQCQRKIKHVVYSVGTVSEWFNPEL